MSSYLVESIVFKSLSILGFDFEHESRKHNVRFGVDMFKSPNVKGMEIILYFLLTKYDPKMKEVSYPLLYRILPY